LADHPKVLMLECLHFSHTTGSLHYDGWMTLQLGCCYRVLLNYQCCSCANTNFEMHYG